MNEGYINKEQSNKAHLVHWKRHENMIERVM